MLGNREDAEDLSQEVFLQLFRKVHLFRGESSFSTWLHRLTINTVLMQMRRHRRWRGAMTSLDTTYPSTEEGGTMFATAVNALAASASISRTPRRTWPGLRRARLGVFQPPS